MAFFDIYRYLNPGTPMGRAAVVTDRVSDEKRAEIAGWLREHGQPDPKGDERCWYCGERDAAEPMGVLLKKGLAVQHVISMTVPLPACAQCRDVIMGRHRAVTRMHHVGFLAGLGGVIALVAVFGQTPHDWIKAILVGFLMTVFIAAVIGASLGWIAVKASAGKTGRLRSELDYPLVKKVLSDGWRPM